MSPSETSHFPRHSPGAWTSSQVLHVEKELATEYPNLSRHIIHMAVILAQAALEPGQGTVRLLAHARRNLGTVSGRMLSA